MTFYNKFVLIQLAHNGLNATFEKNQKVRAIFRPQKAQKLGRASQIYSPNLNIIFQNCVGLKEQVYCWNLLRLA